MAAPASLKDWVKGLSGSSAAALVLPEGLEIGRRYRVRQLLGMGGMGSVYRVHDQELDRDVALKLIRSDVVENPSALERFKREIQLSSRVTHRNVLRVYDLGESDGIRFLTMQFVEGEDLAAVLQRYGKLPVPRLTSIFRQILEGLRAAHEQGVVHRDLKPQNIMVDAADQIYVTDFGLAKSLEQAGMTQTGTVVGTPYYMSPEQVKGSPVDARSDIYSAGVILYQMATGQLPFTGNTPYEVMSQRVLRSPRPAGELNPQLPGYLRKILERCMAVDPATRYASVGDVLRDLESGSFRTTFRFETGRRRWLKPVLLSIAAIVLAAGAVIWFQRGVPAGSPDAERRRAGSAGPGHRPVRESHRTGGPRLVRRGGRPPRRGQPGAVPAPARRVSGSHGRASERQRRPRRASPGGGRRRHRVPSDRRHPGRPRRSDRFGPGLRHPGRSRAFRRARRRPFPADAGGRRRPTRDRREEGSGSSARRRGRRLRRRLREQEPGGLRVVHRGAPGRQRVSLPGCTAGLRTVAVQGAGLRDGALLARHGQSGERPHRGGARRHPTGRRAGLAAARPRGAIRPRRGSLFLAPLRRRDQDVRGSHREVPVRDRGPSHPGLRPARREPSEGGRHRGAGSRQDRAREPRRLVDPRHRASGDEGLQPGRARLPALRPARARKRERTSPARRRLPLTGGIRSGGAGVREGARRGPDLPLLDRGPGDGGRDARTARGGGEPALGACRGHEDPPGAPDRRGVRARRRRAGRRPLPPVVRRPLLAREADRRGEDPGGSVALRARNGPRGARPAPAGARPDRARHREIARRSHPISLRARTPRAARRTAGRGPPHGGKDPGRGASAGKPGPHRTEGGRLPSGTRAHRREKSRRRRSKSSRRRSRCRATSTESTGGPWRTPIWRPAGFPRPSRPRRSPRRRSIRWRRASTSSSTGCVRS